MAEKAMSEIGPWAAVRKENSVYVESDDFTHDVSLQVLGDFATGERKLAYAHAIAAALNAAMPLKFE